jgi:EpsD family peptidyl-prolyl cis-trans isomerase
MQVVEFDARNSAAMKSGWRPPKVPRLAIAGLLGALSLVGCDKAPGGQVVAVVGDDEITLTELRAEARTPPTAAGPEVLAANAAALARLTDRNILASYARDQGFDRSPDYVEKRRQIEQQLLASLAIRELAGPSPKPTAAEVQRFIDANPTLFARRQRLDIDRIKIETPGDPKVIQSLVKLQNLDAAQARLAAQGMKFERGRGYFDTASVDPTVAGQIAALPNGEVFDLTTGGATYISAVTGRTPLPSTPDNWKAAATAAVARQRVADKVEGQLGKLRKATKIDYDSAYRPKSPTA